MAALQQSSTREAATSSSPVKGLKAARMKASLAGPFVVPIIFCLLFLESSFLFLAVGLKSGIDLSEAEGSTYWDLIERQKNQTQKEELLHIEYNHLMELTLHARYAETYTECLVRGIHYAHNHYEYAGVEYTTNPQIVNGTMTWVHDVCAKNVYTPQLFEPPPRYINLGLYARAADAVHHFVADLPNKVVRAYGWIVTKCTGATPGITKAERREVPAEEKPRVLLPPDFRLEEHTNATYRLAYNAPTMATASDLHMNQERIKKLELRHAEQTAFIHRLDVAYSATRQIVNTLLPIRVFFMALAALFQMELPALTYKATHTSTLLSEEKHLLTWAIMQLASYTVDKLTSKYQADLPWFAPPLIAAIGVTGLFFWFFTRCPFLPNISLFSAAVVELVRFMGRPLPVVTPLETSTLPSITS